MSMNVSGLVSGIDTSTMITQLMAVEQQQQQALINRKTATQKAADAYTNLITALNDLSTAATALTDPTKWKGTTATSSSSSVSVTSSGTDTASFTFDVNSLAAAHSMVSGASVSGTTTVVAGSQISLTSAGGTSTTLDVGAGTLSEVVGAINNADAGVRAASVQTAPGQYRLQLTATTTGAGSAFTVSGVTGMGSMNVLTQGSDATITIGTDPATQYTATSSSNTFDALVPGLSFTVGAVQSGVTVSTSLDSTSIAAGIQSFVDKANGIMGGISGQSTWDATNKVGGVLFGDSTVASLSQRILAMASGSGVPGLGVSKDGSISFDSTAFKTAYTANPAAVAKSLAGDATTGAQGFAQKYVRLADQMTHYGTGALQLGQQGKTSTMTDLQNQIDSWDIRLALRKTTLTTQFTAMETALSGLQSQSSFVSGLSTNMLNGIKYS